MKVAVATSAPMPPALALRPFVWESCRVGVSVVDVMVSVLWRTVVRDTRYSSRIRYMSVR